MQTPHMRKFGKKQRSTKFNFHGYAHSLVGPTRSLYVVRDPCLKICTD